ncbi:hypothetical protein RHA1_ro08940 (plasmid) [Rhodococcus jostii RHA1]|uniref:Uncharacterized protein n=1 Tax=Rhodococcus jostii (strain RHA1) TaxID=101510 RepID=Q0RXK2_RHOJR|nr:hypothetical protein RHA1_ro08940 [Rhodococcus jostii RHA1]
MEASSGNLMRPPKRRQTGLPVSTITSVMTHDHSHNAHRVSNKSAALPYRAMHDEHPYGSRPEAPQFGRPLTNQSAEKEIDA